MSEPAIDKSGARTRYCRDCRHITLPSAGQYDLAKCARKEATTFDADYLVTGNGESRQHFCSTMRTPMGLCGLDGVLWEKRNG